MTSSGAARRISDSAARRREASEDAICRDGCDRHDARPTSFKLQRRRGRPACGRRLHLKAAERSCGQLRLLPDGGRGCRGGISQQACTCTACAAGTKPPIASLSSCLLMWHRHESEKALNQNRSLAMGMHSQEWLTGQRLQAARCAACRGHLAPQPAHCASALDNSD